MSFLISSSGNATRLFNIEKPFQGLIYMSQAARPVKSESANIPPLPIGILLEKLTLWLAKRSGRASVGSGAVVPTHLCAERGVATMSAVGQTLSHTHRRERAGH